MDFTSFIKSIRRHVSGFLTEPDKEMHTDGRTLYLHIGMPKTGTSAIQNFLFNNRDVLARQGIYYPDSVLHWSQHVPIVKSIVSSRFKDARFNQWIPEIDLNNLIENLMKTCESENYNKVILSSEFFWAAPAMQSEPKYHEVNEENFSCIEQVVKDCRSLFSCFDTVKVVVYIRKQGEWLESFFNQQIKNGFPIPSEDDLLQTKNYLLYDKNIKLWQYHFGVNNVIVKVFEETAHDLINGFCQTVSIRKNSDISSSSLEPQSANTRLSARATGIMREAIRKKMSKERIELLREVLQHTSSAIGRVRLNSRQNIFSETFHQQIHSIYADDNMSLARSIPAASRYLVEEKFSSTKPGKEETDTMIPEERVELLVERILADVRVTELTE